MKARSAFARNLAARKRHALFPAAILAMIVGSPASAIEATADEEASVEQAVAEPERTHLAEAVRATVNKVVVLPTQGPVGDATTGSYKRNTEGLYGGAAKGSSAGSGVGVEIGPVRTRISIPILAIPGMLIGGAAGKADRDIQDFRDRLTDDLADEASPPLTNDALASDVWWGLRRVPNLDSKVFALTTPIPEDTDAILYVGLEKMTIDVQGKDAVISTTASATLQRLSDGEHLYEEELRYQDRDTLSNWTRNENALWHDYANYARHYFGREISAEVFDRVELNHELRPKETANVKRVKKNDWRGLSKTSTPTLAWELKLLGGDDYGEWVSKVKPADIAYDVEIYDMQRLIYSAKQVSQSSHTVEEELPCKTLRWSVRPSYRVADGIKFGEWMRFSSESQNAKANDGRRASEAPAYIQDFPSLTLKCKRR